MPSKGRGCHVAASSVVATHRSLLPPHARLACSCFGGKDQVGAGKCSGLDFAHLNHAADLLLSFLLPKPPPHSSSSSANSPPPIHLHQITCSSSFGLLSRTSLTHLHCSSLLKSPTVTVPITVSRHGRRAPPCHGQHAPLHLSPF